MFGKMAFFGDKNGLSLALFSILSAQNIIIVHPSWFYPSSGMKIKSPESQNFGHEKMIFVLLLMRFMRIDAHLMHIDAHQCASAKIGTWPSLVSKLEDG